MKKQIILGVFIMASCSQKIQPPNAIKKNHKMTMHGDTRIDNYYWMRLTDEQKSTRPYDDHTKKVVDYINLENNYTQASLLHTKDLQESIFDEIVGRIQKDDNTVPYMDNGYYYYSRYEEGKEYAIYCRKKGSLESHEEILLDANDCNSSIFTK